MRRVVFISRTIRLGKTISVCLRSRPSQMDRAAWPTSMMKGMGKGLRAVRSVRTKPGQIVVTCTPVRARWTRSDSRRLIWAALVAP